MRERVIPLKPPRGLRQRRAADHRSDALSGLKRLGVDETQGCTLGYRITHLRCYGVLRPLSISPKSRTISKAGGKRRRNSLIFAPPVLGIT